MKHKAEHLDELFFLSRPDLFFGSIQIIILPISLYFAMWIVNFSAVHTTSGWKVRILYGGEELCFDSSANKIVLSNFARIGQYGRFCIHGSNSSSAQGKYGYHEYF